MCTLYIDVGEFYDITMLLALVYREPWLELRGVPVQLSVGVRCVHTLPL